MSNAHEPVQLKRTKMGLHKIIAAANEPNMVIRSGPTLRDLRAGLLESERQSSDASVPKEVSLDSPFANHQIEPIGILDWIMHMLAAPSLRDNAKPT